MLVSRFIYDLACVQKPTEDELTEEIEQLLFIRTAEQPTYLVAQENRDQLSNMDSDILSNWLDKKFKSAFVLLLLDHGDNYQGAKVELCLMERYNTLVDKFLRPRFVKKLAMERVRELYFADSNVPDLKKTITNIKRALTFLSEHLEHKSREHTTLLGTEAYTQADVTLYNYLKRICVGKYKDFGLKSHVRLCEPLIRFMRRYAQKNPHVTDISSGDPLASDNNESSLVADVVKPATVAVGFIIFYLWCRRK